MMMKNRKAYFNYSIIDTYTAGIVLVGSEVKSLKSGAVGFSDAYCFIKDGELFLKNLNIPEFKWANINNHEPIRDRKLLMKKKEIARLDKKKREGGLTIVPLKIFTQGKRGIIKVEIGLAKGKKLYDKRSVISDRENKIKINRTKKTKRL
jgi:SsrA-binding protein